MAWDSYTPTGQAAPASGGAAGPAVSYALAQVGKPYRWAGSGPDAFDCSGLTMRAYQQIGISLPHFSTAQAGLGTAVDASNPAAWLPGDLLFPFPGHVAMYVGGGQLVDAWSLTRGPGSTGGVRQVAVKGSYWRVRRYVGAGMGTGSGVTLAQLLAGERAQESGGNYTDVNQSSGALGAYQVMPSNLAAWTKAALGHTDTRAQFLASPSDQDKVAAYELGSLYNKYGAAGAAAAWYSGNPALAGDTAPQPGGPSIAQYVQDVLSKASGSPGVQTVGYQPTGLLSSAAGGVWDAVKPTLVTLAFASVGFALVVVGAAITAKPVTNAVGGEAKQAAGMAAMLA